MTVEQLSQLFNTNFGLSPWPKTYEVDHETYANVCQFAFENNPLYDGWPDSTIEGFLFKRVALGKHNGIMFKNVELHLKKM